MVVHIYNLNTQAGISTQLQSLTCLVAGLQVNQGYIAQGYITVSEKQKQQQQQNPLILKCILNPQPLHSTVF